MVAQDLSDAALGGPIGMEGRHFIDKEGRVLLLRGVNVAGASKLPSVPHDVPTTYSHPEDVSFVDRPFPLSEAHVHCQRLKQWGLTLIRLLVTWEALSHQGPCPEYPIDQDYVAYLVQLLDIFHQHGLKCIINAHQDVWSRLCGGSGAPAWTFRAAGMDTRNLVAVGAALVPDAGGIPMACTPPKGKKEPTGPFNWPSGYQKMAPCTMNTLFWAGSVFAPHFRLLRDGYGRPRSKEDAVSIQDFLQDAYIAAYTQLVQALADCAALIGFEVMNEPHRGYINLHSFHQWNFMTDLHIGHYPSAIQGLALAQGYPQRVPFYVKSWPVPSRMSHLSYVDPKGHTAWLARAENTAFPSTRTTDGCIWREHGVWDWDEDKNKPVVLQAHYFDWDPRAGQEERRVEWYRDFYAPFIQKMEASLRHAMPSLLVLVEPIPNEFMPRWDGHAKPVAHTPKTSMPLPRPKRFVYAPHFYDLNVLFFKSYKGMSVNVQGLSRGMFLPFALYFGQRGLAKNYLRQISTLVRRGQEALGAVPTLMSEVGIPFDVNGSLHTMPGNYRTQTHLLDALIAAMEKNWVSFTLWNYNPSNTVAQGDLWNMEDFSIINLEAEAQDRANRHQTEAAYAGGRALDAIVRPYACKVAGLPMRTSWDRHSCRFQFSWRNKYEAEGSVQSRTTEIYVPDYVFRHRTPTIRVSDGTWHYEPADQTLVITHAHTQPGAIHTVYLSVPELERSFRFKGIMWATVLLVLLLALWMQPHRLT